MTNSQARAQFGAGVGNWWNHVRSGDAYTIGQTTAVAASLFLGGKDINTEVGYCEMKNKAGKEPREPLDWKEASERWAELGEQGKVFADGKFNEFVQKYENAQPEITIVTNEGEGTKIRVDAISTDEEGNVIIQEYKSSETAPYTKN